MHYDKYENNYKVTEKQLFNKSCHISSDLGLKELNYWNQENISPQLFLGFNLEGKIGGNNLDSKFKNIKVIS